MDAQIERHQPLITARLVFRPKTFPPPPIITLRMDFPPISIVQQHERSPTPEIRTPRKHSLTPKRPKIGSTPNRYSTPQRDDTPRPTPKRASLPTIETRRSRGASVAFEGIGSPLTEMSDDDDEPESEEGEEVRKKLPKPQGEAGRPQSGGYDLQDKLNWNDRTYESILVGL